jgi:nucleotide-binding universal stress UspA family protein
MKIWWALALWVSVGPILALVMGRLGYSPAGWGLVGMMLGPLAVPAAAGALWHRSAGTADVVAIGDPGSGTLAVLAGIDGSEFSRAALERAVGLLGDRIGRLTVAAVVPFDTVATDAQAWLDAAGASLRGTHPEVVLAHGDPAAVLVRLAHEGRYDLLVVGSRGRGLSPLLFGSVARTVVAQSQVPVLLGGHHLRAGPSSEHAGARTPEGAVS